MYFDVPDLLRKRKNSIPQSDETKEIIKKMNNFDFYENVFYKKPKEKLSIEPFCIEKIGDYHAIGFKGDFYNHTLSWSKDNRLVCALKTRRDEEIYQIDMNDRKKNAILIDSTNTEFNCLHFDNQNNLYTSDIISIDSNMIGRINVYNRNYLRVKRLYFPSKCTVIDTTDNIAALGGRRNLGFIDTRSYEYIKLSYSPRIVGMKWSPDKNHVLIGYHDNFIKVLDIRKTFDQNSYIFEDTSYNAAIKGMDWIDSNSFVTGGGTGDHTVRLYDFSKKRLIDKMDTRSQITGIVMNKSKKEMIISHGFSAKGLIKVRIDNFKLVKKGEILDYHDNRITSMVISPDRTKIATVSRDEILKVGKVFEKSICKKPMLFENKKHRFVLR